LEGGIIARTTAAQAVYLPAGCIHAVFTLRGGFLASTDVSTRESVWPFSQYLRHQLQRDLDPQGQDECYFLFLQSLRLSLHNDRWAQALRSWNSIEGILAERAARHREWKLEVQRVWQEATQNGPVDEVCAYGLPSVKDSDPHLYRTSLKWLFEEPNIHGRDLGPAWQGPKKQIRLEDRDE
jgi:hypothetical protein